MDTAAAKKCPNAKKHTRSPLTYLARYSWAQDMMKGHRQLRCPGCGLYKIWVSKTPGKRVRQPKGYVTCLT
jgi:hypothetical protein